MGERRLHRVRGGLQCPGGGPRAAAAKSPPVLAAAFRALLTALGPLFLRDDELIGQKRLWGASLKPTSSWHARG